MMWNRKGICFDVLNEGVGGSSELPRSEPGRPRKITCEFCECELGNSGEYKRLSEKAKGYRDSDEKIERLQAELMSVRADLATARQAVPAPVTQRDTRPGGIAL
jgi:hypothetical protein